MVASDPNDPRSPWCAYVEEPSKQAGFVEYLRWLRLPSNNKTLNSAKLLELLQQIDICDYSKNLQRLSHRIEKVSDISFKVSCPWRIRIGGIRGPEAMLLPAFDATGFPYLPSSSLKGVARSVAKRTHASPTLVEHIFGKIDPESSVGNIVFLDAYPTEAKPRGGLRSDMTNAIWKWENNQAQPQYNSNPNIFLSLYQPEFIIGVRRGLNASEEDLEIVKQWLLVGLNQGIGSRVNSGYGQLCPQPVDLITLPKDQQPAATPFLKIPFELKGQLIHGYHTVRWIYIDKDNQWQPRTSGDAEVRSTAFRSMLRYWFRTFSLGVFSEEITRSLEMEIFGGIEPQPKAGLFRLEIINSDSSANSYEQFGELNFKYSAIEPTPQTEDAEKRMKSKRARLAKLINSLTWLMFHLGGIGQGARRPYYQRPNQNPSCRGANLIPGRDGVKPDKLVEIWQLPSNIQEFSIVFQQQVEQFYWALGTFVGERSFNWKSKIRPVGEPVDQHVWSEALNSSCMILAVHKLVMNQGSNKYPKPWPLQELSNQFHVLENRGTPLDKSLSKSLCGGVFKEEMNNKDPRKRYPIDRGVTPSPIWIKNLGRYQIVTVFGAKHSPRADYIETIKQKSESFSILWPPND